MADLEAKPTPALFVDPRGHTVSLGVIPDDADCNIKIAVEDGASMSFPSQADFSRAMAATLSLSP